MVSTISNSTPLDALLDGVGWPIKGEKGMATWQGEASHDKLPPTVSMILTPKAFKAKIFNVLPSAELQPHLVAEFALDGPTGQPTLVSWKDAAGTQPSGSTADQVNEAARLIRAFVTTIGGAPKADSMGPLFKTGTNPATP